MRNPDLKTFLSRTLPRRAAAFRWLGAVLILAGCATAPHPPAAPPEPAAPLPQAWTGPAEFSADYLWNADRPAAPYDRPVKLLRLLVRQGKAVRAVGLDVFGATLFDELIQTAPGGKIQTRFRQGAENIDGLLLEQAVRRVFFAENLGPRVIWLKDETGLPGKPSKLLAVKIGDDTVELQLAGATVASQLDADFDYPAAP